MSTELARVPAGIVPLTLDDLERAMHMAGRAAGAQAALQIMVGQAAGLSIGQCLTDVHMMTVRGVLKPTLSATAQLAMARRAGVRTRWVEASDTAAELELTPPGDEPTRWRVTMEDAARAGWSTGKNAETWQRNAGAMLRARAITRGIRAACPEVLGGMSLYDADELQDARAMTVATVATVAAATVAEQAQPRAVQADTIAITDSATPADARRLKAEARAAQVVPPGLLAGDDGDAHSRALDAHGHPTGWTAATVPAIIAAEVARAASRLGVSEGELLAESDGQPMTIARLADLVSRWPVDVDLGGEE